MIVTYMLYMYADRNQCKKLGKNVCKKEVGRKANQNTSRKAKKADKNVYTLLQSFRMKLKYEVRLPYFVKSLTIKIH